MDPVPPSPPAAPLAGDALEALGYALFARDTAGTLRLVASPPAWLAQVWPAVDRVGAELPVGNASPFLENFLIDAAACWEQGGGTQVASGPWVENGPGGLELDLEATALTLKGARPALLVERLGEAYAARKTVLQIGRETVLLNQRLNAEVQKKSILLHFIAEEMSASLANIITCLRLIERERDPAYTQRLLDLASLATQAQQRHINHVLDGFAEEFNDLYGAQSRAEVGETVRRVLASVNTTFAERRVRLLAPDTANTSRPPLLVAVNAGHLERVLGNLLANALDATPAGGEVTIQLHEEADAVRLVVMDAGASLPAEIVETLVARAGLPSGKSAAAMRLHFCRVVAEDCHGDFGYTPRDGHGGSNLAWVSVPKVPPANRVPSGGQN